MSRRRSLPRTDSRARRAWAGPLAAGTFLAGVAGMMARSREPYPRPGASAEDVSRFFTQRSGGPWIGVTGQGISAASVAVWTTTITELARDDRRLQALAIAGGATSALALGASAATTAALVAGDHDSERLLRLHHAAFVAGGPIHGAGFGLLLAALGFAGERTGRLPRPLTRAAQAAAAPNLLSLLSLRWPPGAWLIPAGRFPGLAVTAIAGARLARRHK